MRKLSLIALLLTIIFASAQAQLLYKISGKDLQKPSYIVGTYHLASDKFADSIVGVKEAMNEIEQVYGEINMLDMTSPGSIQKLQDAMTLPEGTTLSTLLTKEQMERLNSYLMATMGADMRNPMVASQMDKLKPAALLTQFTVLAYMQKHMGEFDPMNLIDSYFQKVAQKNNMFVGGFETLEFQTQTVFSKTPLNRQVEQLMCFIDNIEFNQQMMEDLISAYYKQDLDAIEKVMKTKMNSSCDPTPEEEAQLISDRNENWIKMMPAIMAEKSTFFAVGAGHLPGEKGVLQLLRNAGYTVEAMK